MPDTYKTHDMVNSLSREKKCIHRYENPRKYRQMYTIIKPDLAINVVSYYTLHLRSKT